MAWILLGSSPATAQPSPEWYPGAPAYWYPPGHSVAPSPRNPPYAPDDRSAWEKRPLAFVVELGGPLGLGATLEHSPSRWFSYGAGLGISFGGLQGGVRTRLRAGGEHHAAYLGPGFAVGDWSSCVMFCEHAADYESWSPGYFLVGETGYEYRASGGFTLRAYLGASKILNVSDGSCGDGIASRECRGKLLGFGGIALGYAFGS